MRCVVTVEWAPLRLCACLLGNALAFPVHLAFPALLVTCWLQSEPSLVRVCYCRAFATSCQQNPKREPRFVNSGFRWIFGSMPCHDLQAEPQGGGGQSINKVFRRKFGSMLCHELVVVPHAHWRYPVVPVVLVLIMLLRTLVRRMLTFCVGLPSALAQWMLARAQPCRPQLSYLCARHILHAGLSACSSSRAGFGMMMF